MNRITIKGLVGTKPETKTNPNGSERSKIAVAVNESWKDTDGSYKKRTEWFNVISFNPKFCKKMKTLEKGDLVMVEGKMTHSKYKDKSGIERKIFFISLSDYAHSLDIIAKPKKTTEEQPEKGNSIHDDDIPF